MARLGAMASLFTTMLYTGALGADDSLDDQQLAAYPVVALFIGSKGLRRSAA